MRRQRRAAIARARAAAPADQTFWQRFLPDAIYGANDGLITTFAIVAGVVGASLDDTIILILGFANLIADGFSMGASNVLSKRSSSDPAERDGRIAFEHGLVTFVAFLLAGAVPLIAYLAPVPDDTQFALTMFLTLAALFVIGASRAFVLKSHWFRNGMEMLVIGALAAAVAYGIGAFGASISG